MKESPVLSSGADVLVQGCHTSLSGTTRYHLSRYGQMRVVRCSSDRDHGSVSAEGDITRLSGPGEKEHVPNLTVQEVVVRRAEVHGMIPSGRMVTHINNFCLVGSGQYGIWIVGAVNSSKDTMNRVIRDTVVQKSSHGGLPVGDQARVHCVNVLARDSNAPGFVTYRSGSYLKLECCSSKRNEMHDISKCYAVLVRDYLTLKAFGMWNGQEHKWVAQLAS